MSHTELIAFATSLKVELLYPMSGLDTEEPILQPGRVDVLLGQGRTADVLRNLCLAVAKTVGAGIVAPGAVDSSWMVEWTNEERQQSIERALLKRRCTPEDLAEVVLFLGFGAAMVTGQTITVDGGLTL